MALLHRYLACALAITAVATARPSHAQLALDFTGGAAIFNGGAGVTTFGWSFSTSSAIQVTSLGVFDETNNGLVNSHQVGIWTSGGVLLSSVTVPSGTGSTAISSASGSGSFRFISLVAPTALAAGSYVIGASYIPSDADSLFATATTVTTASPVSFGAGRNGNGSFTFPVNSFDVGNGPFGANFQFTGVAAGAPEPGSLALLSLVGMVGITAVRRRRAH